MRVLVTGNLGYIGPVVTRALKAAGHYVIGLDTGWFLPNVAALPVWPDEQLFADIRQIERHEFDAVVHLAGLSNDPMGAIDENLTNEINYIGTYRVLFTHMDARHVIVSSCSVYGANEMATEESEPNPLTMYAKCKASVDAFARDIVDVDPRFESVSLRLGTVYGYSPGHRLDLVVNRMTYDAVRGKGITVNGNASRPLTHVEDVASAIVFMLERPETGIYNVVGENYKMVDLGYAVSDFTKAKLMLRAGGADQRDYAADGSKLRALGWEPQHTVVGSLPDLAAKTADLPGIYTRYERLTALKKLIASGAITPDLRRKDPVAA